MNFSFVRLAGIGLSVLAVVSSSWAAESTPASALHWVKFDHHSHLAAGTLVGDSGELKLEDQQKLFATAGYELVTHSPHSDFNKEAGAAASWLKQKAVEEKPGLPGPVRSLGLELTVERGPLFFAGGHLGPLPVPANNEHMGLFGIPELIPHGTPMKAACEWTHLLGGVVIVNHPGPGPGMWETGYWERAGLRDRIDGLEVYNDHAARMANIAFDSRYREAIAYSGLRLKLAAMGATDFHVPAETPTSATMALARECSVEALKDAIRQRRTVAISGFPRLEVECAYLGQVLCTNRVTLEIKLPQAADRIVLYRETEIQRAWTNAASAKLLVAPPTNTAYSWLIERGTAHACSSGIWIEPQHEPRADLVVTPEDIRVDGRTVRVLIRNNGDEGAQDFKLQVMAGLPYAKGKLKAEKFVPVIGPRSKEELSVDWGEPIPAGSIIYVKADAESFALDCDDHHVNESDKRNNAAMKIVTSH